MKLYQLFTVAIIISCANDMGASKAKSPEQKYLWIKCAETNNHSYLKRCSLCDGKNKNEILLNHESHDADAQTIQNKNCSQYKRCSKCELKHGSKNSHNRTCC